jgi:predicted MPP superfamily phosphohydrolase
MAFCVNGANFGPEQYYRDDEQARAVLGACRKNPVLVTGLRRIGKRWFLRRFEQIFQAGATRHFDAEGTPRENRLEPGMPTAVTLLDAGSEDLEQRLGDVLARRDHRQVLAIDELESFATDPSRNDLLKAILAYRPLILAAAPSVHALVRKHGSDVAKFFERECVPVILAPLADAERRALMFQTCDPGEGVLTQHEGLVLEKRWGGHPLVLQQVGELVRGNPKLKFAALVNMVHAALNGGPRYGHSLCETGLTSAQREVLVRVAAGDPPPSDDHTALDLQAHGAILKRGKGWVVENVVLQRYFDGLPRKRSDAPPGSEKIVAPPKLPAPVRVFTWIHLSDLHFGAGTTGYRFDHKAVMRAIARDVEAHAPKGVDRIFVTGDIAFSAQPEEYDEARTWMERIAQHAGVGHDRLRFVPGNHDVDRKVAKKPLLRSVHHAARERVVDLDDALADKDARVALAAKLEPYQRFVSKFAGHPAPLATGIDWVEILDKSAGGHGPIRIAGLSTVWTSDELDGKDQGGKGFVRNLVLPHGPLDQTAGEATATEIVLLLTHHPPEWIAPRTDGVDLLSRELARLPHIHLYGHVHDANAGSTRRHGRSGRSLWYVAGAAHSDPSEAAKHGYAWGAVRYDPGKPGWQAGWAPRVYVDGEMCADSTGRDLDGGGFAWEDIACPWPAPVG